MSRILTRIDVETHQEAFEHVLRILALEGLLRGGTIGLDATTLEANAAMRSIVGRDDGATYDEYLVGLAKESAIATTAREDFARVDRKREKQGSNDDWTQPDDPDARIVNMKDGRTHLAHKSEHAIDMDTSAVIWVTVQEATVGEPSTTIKTIAAAMTSLRAVAQDERCANELTDRWLCEWDADNCHHPTATMKMANDVGLKSHISEPKCGRRRWNGKESERGGTYANRRRLKTRRGRDLMRRRGELLERCFSHCLESGRMRGVHLRRRVNILKRYLMHVATFNLSLVMRVLIGGGTPRGLQSGLRGLVATLCAWIRLALDDLVGEGQASARRPRFETATLLA